MRILLRKFSDKSQKLNFIKFNQIMSTSISDYLVKRIGEGALKVSDGKICRTDSEWQEIGARNLKRRLLGFCGRESAKSIDEFARIFMDLKIVESYSEGIKLAESLDGKSFHYGYDSRIHFSRIKDEKNFIKIEKKHAESQSYRLSPYADEPN